MATKYIPKATVTCQNCGDGLTRRRRSASGTYYCSKPDCQSVRRKAWHGDKADAKLKRAEEAHEAALLNSAKFIEAALFAERVQCPKCGLKNGLRGYGHFAGDGSGCDGLGARVEGVTFDHALAVWPKDSREYATF